MKAFFKVLFNYKKAAEALFDMRILTLVLEKNKSKSKKGPEYLYGAIGQATVELVEMFNEEQ